MKKTKYVTFSLCEEDYNKLKQQAEKDRRTLANYITLLVLDYLGGLNNVK